MNEQSVRCICKYCNKSYSSRSSLCNHIKKFHNGCNNTDNTLDNTYNTLDNTLDNTCNITYSCRICNDKSFKNYQNRWKHEKICKINKNKKKDTKSLIELKKEIESIKNNITNIKKNNKKIINTNNGTINANTNNNNNNINITQFGSESLSKLTSEDIKKIADSNYNSVIEIVKLLNFNKKFPENHNFCTTSLEGSYVNVYNADTKQIDKINKDDFYNNVLAKSMDKMDRLVFMLEFDDNYEEIREKYKKILEDIIKDPIVFCRKSSKTTYNKNINQMSYNNKNMILDTWTTRMKDYEDDGGESIFTDIELSSL
jgi:hypothetical protein